MNSIRNSRITDLTIPYKEPMRGYRKQVSKELKRDGWNATTLEIYSHAGTHMDAPLHFEAGEGTIDQVSPDRLICSCHIVRLAPATPAQMISVSDLGDIAFNIKPGEGIILHTGWSEYKDDSSVYRDQLPRLSIELAKWMVEKRINLVGVEPPSIADVNNLDELQSVHRILLDAGVLILEGLCNLESVKANYGQLIAMPLKIAGGDGAPTRAVFIENEHL